jgi:glycosyltransferase involved in cell wall biosynthesis
MKLSIVIPCRNGARTLRDTLEALARQRWTQPWEVIFADNGSTDGSAELALRFRDQIPNFRLVDASLRRGQPFALNTGAHAARGEAIAFTDADDQVADGWVAAMGDALAKHEMVACRTDATKFNPPWLQSSPQRDGIQQLWYPPWLSHVGGGTLGLRKALFEAIGDFDEDLPYLHDTDLCIRAQLYGAKIHFVPDAVLYLHHRSTLGAYYRQSVNLAEYNVILAKRYWQSGAASSIFWKRYAKDWLKLIRLAGSARSPICRFQFAWFLGRQIGRAKGVLKYRGVPV